MQLVNDRLKNLAIEAIRKNGYNIDYEWVRFVDTKNYKAYAVNICGHIFEDCAEDELVVTLCDLEVYGGKDHVKESKYNPFVINLDKVA